jgi:hypothetical protein
MRNELTHIDLNSEFNTYSPIRISGDAQVAPAYLRSPQPHLPSTFTHKSTQTRLPAKQSHLALPTSAPLTSPIRTQPLNRVIASRGTMCTYFTLTYKCGHAQTSHRCPRSTVYVYGKNGEQAPQIKGCDNSYSIGAGLQDNCVDCKMQEGHMPGVMTGVDKWSTWGPKEDALAMRVKGVQEGVCGTNVLIEGGTLHGAVQHENSGTTTIGEVAEGWEEQMRAVLMDQRRGQTQTSETIASGARNGSLQTEWNQEVRRVKGQDEEEDDWMWGGMKSFGGEEARKRGKWSAGT